MKALTILIAEDDENDVMLYTRAISKIDATHQIRIVNDGEEAIRYLRGEGEYCDRTQFPFPQILLFDLKMPRRNGLEVLQWVRDHEECAVIPTIILTSSTESEDIKRAYRLGASSYFAKPSQFSDTIELFRMIFHYWCETEVPQPPIQGKCR